MADARVSLPPDVRRGQPFEVRISIRHAMETGYRTDETGKSEYFSGVQLQTGAFQARRGRGGFYFEYDFSRGMSATGIKVLHFPTCHQGDNVIEVGVFHLAGADGLAIF